MAAKLGGIESGLGDISSSVTQATERAERAEDARREAEGERDDALDAASAAVAAQRDAELALAKVVNDKEEVEIALTSARADLSRAEAQIEVAVLDGFIPNQAVQPLVAGRVIDINNSITPGLVALNVGTERGVERGMTFEIYSGDSYKGRVRVASVVADKCSAVIVVNPPDSAGIERGDYASTRL